MALRPLPQPEIDCSSGWNQFVADPLGQLSHGRAVKNGQGLARSR